MCALVLGAMGPLENATILIHCQHPILTLGIQSLFERRSDLKAIVTSGAERAIDIARTIQPDVIVLDMNSEFDLGFLRAIKRQSPESKAVLWIESISTELAFQAFNLGVTGIINKTLSPDEFLQDLRAVAQGNIRIEPELMDAIIMAKTVKLTKRESELVMLVAQGLKNKEIGAELNITENTVKAYLSRLFQKLNVKDRLDLALYGLKNLKAPSGPIEQRQPNAFLPSAFSRNAATRMFDPTLLHLNKD
jgi:DNA-binding NarL/FixJ family response regulator